ncbi:MAG: HlyD family efflux transporter periplasmic adaptor subunit [Rhodoferax sp.]|nr:HlyD family efflux transporter periplasmic adaptor subunit [Rhodoferax sp.]
MAEAPADDAGAPSALALYADLLSANSLASAAHRLVAALAHDLQFDRVSIGLREGSRTRLLASTDLDPSQPQAEPAAQVLGAMDEALEQALVLVCSGAPSDGDMAPQAIALEHQLLQRQVGGSVATLPLGFDGEPFAAVCVERHHGPAPDAQQMQRLEHLLLLAAPALRWMARSEMPWHRRARQGLARAWASLREPGHRTRRTALAASALALLFIAAVPMDHAVGGRARVEGAQQRVLSAPTDGFIKTAHVRPGDRVRQGDPMVDLIEEDLQLEHERWISQRAQHENAYAAAMAKSDRVGASTSFARVNEAQAQLDLIEQLRSRSRITAPFDALVVQGDLSQSIGAPVRQGDALLTLASTDGYRVVIQVDESDIARVSPGQAGQLVVSALPWQGQALEVERVTPLARAVEGRNVFEVRARLRTATQELRPGLIGRAELVVGRQPLLWTWLGRLAARARLAWWSWIG